MKKNLLLTCCLAGLLSVSALADNEQTVMVDGASVDKAVKQITFRGNFIVLHYADGTEQETDDVTRLKIAFSVTDAIRSLSSDRLSDTVEVFDMSGKLVNNVGNAQAADCLNGLQKGAYIVKKGSKTVKLIKN